MKKGKTTNDALAAKIAGRIVNRQRQLAGKLSRWAGSYSRRQQAIAFAVFCLFFGLYCLYILYTAIF